MDFLGQHRADLSTAHLLQGVYVLTAVDYDNQQYYKQKVVKVQ
jgi:hypothetical protein